MRQSATSHVCPLVPYRFFRDADMSYASLLRWSRYSCPRPPPSRSLSWCTPRRHWKGFSVSTHGPSLLVSYSTLPFSQHLIDVCSHSHPSHLLVSNGTVGIWESATRRETQLCALRPYCPRLIMSIHRRLRFRRYNRWCATPTWSTSFSPLEGLPRSTPISLLHPSWAHPAPCGLR